MTAGIPQRYSVTVTTAADGSATVYLPATVSDVTAKASGRIHSLTYTKSTFEDGVDFTITVEGTGQTVWTDTNINASETVYPLAAGNLGTGAASTLTEVPIVIANDRIKIVIAAGGNAKAGTFTAIIG